MTRHSLPARLFHWTNAAALVTMTGSGWHIFNDAPFLPIRFPEALTLGHWLGGALAIHFAAMWLLACNFLGWMLWGTGSGHLRARLLNLRMAELKRDIIAALAFRLRHDGAQYNAVQKLLYLAALCGIAGAVGSGIVLWKPVQFAAIAGLLGGYEGVRLAHFAAMTGLVLFAALHVVMVALVPATLPPMLTGGAGAP